MAVGWQYHLNLMIERFTDPEACKTWRIYVIDNFDAFNVALRKPDFF